MSKFGCLELGLAVLLFCAVGFIGSLLRNCGSQSVPRPQELSQDGSRCLKHCFDCRTRCGRLKGIDNRDCLATCYDMNWNCCEANDATARDGHCGCR